MVLKNNVGKVESPNPLGSIPSMPGQRLIEFFKTSSDENVYLEPSVS